MAERRLSTLFLTIAIRNFLQGLFGVYDILKVLYSKITNKGVSDLAFEFF